MDAWMMGRWIDGCYNIYREEALVSQGNPYRDRTGACRRTDRHVISVDSVICSAPSWGKELRIEQR